MSGMPPAAGWVLSTLGAATELIRSGATPRGGANVYVSSGIHLIRSQNVLDNRMSLEGIACIGPVQAKALDSVTVRRDDVLINITGDSVARVTSVDASVLPARVNQHVAIIRPNMNVVGSYLQKLLVRSQMKEHLLALSEAGATRKALTKGMLEDLEIWLPLRSEQEAIAEVLGAFDDKISGNAQEQNLISKLRSSLFIERVKRNAVKARLADVSAFVSRGVAPRYVEMNGVTVLNQRCIRDQMVDLSYARTCHRGSIPSTKILKPGDILINSTGVGTLGRVALWGADIEGTADSHVSIVRAKEPTVSQWILGQALLEAEGRIAQLGEGSTGQTELTRLALGELDVLLPANNDENLANMIMNMQSLQYQLQEENRLLAELRDALLDPLVTGRLRVKDAVKIVEQVV